MKARRGSYKRAAQDLAPIAQYSMLLAVAAHDGEISINDVVKLVRAAYRGEAKERKR